MEGGHNVPLPLPKTYLFKMPLYGHNPLIVWKNFFLQNFDNLKKIIYKKKIWRKKVFFWKIFPKSHRGGTLCPPLHKIANFKAINLIFWHNTPGNMIYQIWYLKSGFSFFLVLLQDFFHFFWGTRTFGTLLSYVIPVMSL